MRNHTVRSRLSVAAGGVSVGGGSRFRIRAAASLAAASLVVAFTGCNKKDDGSRPATIAANPTVPTAPTAPAPMAPPAPTTALGAAPLAPPAAGSPPSPAAGAASPTAGNAKTDSKTESGATITGKILLASSRKANITPSDVVYLVARRVPDNPAARGSLIAVKRYTASSFPIDFTLGAGDMMFKNGAFEGVLTLAARVDKDGDPMTRRKGDVFGTIDRVKVGASGVQIKLDHLQEADESLAAPAAPGTPALPGGLPAGHP